MEVRQEASANREARDKRVHSNRERNEMPSAAIKERAAQVHERLSRAVPNPHVELHFRNPWQLLVAVILSAQSTDKMVNKVMVELLKRWPDAAALGKSDPAELEAVVKSTGFFRNKAKAIREASRVIAEELGGEVPKTMEALRELPGVARKTANVVLGSAYGIPSGITVDTHAMRVSQRLKLTRQKDPVKIEQDLCALFPQKTWIQAGHRFVLHGRYVCVARAPLCSECPLNEICPSRDADPEGTWTARAKKEKLQMESRAMPFSRVP
jgi:endonuclease-3